MKEEIDKLLSMLNKSMSEFDIAATCMAQALHCMCERMDKVETWIQENQKKHH